MPKRLTDEKIKCIVAEYLTNGMLKSVALKAVGYSDRYATTAGLKLYDNKRVKEEINRQTAIISQKTGITVSNQQLELIKDRASARQTGDHKAAIRCTELLLKTIGGFKADEPSDKAIAAKIISGKDRALLEQISVEYLTRKYLSVDVIDSPKGPQDAAGSTNTEGKEDKPPQDKKADF